MKAITCAIFVTVFSVLSPARATGGVGGVQPTGTISFIQSQNNGSFTIMLTGNPLLCDTGKGGDRTHASFVVNSATMTAEGVKNALSIATAAYLAGKTVRIYTDNAVVTPSWGCASYGLDIYNP